ncbi:MAG: hypothetical protein QMC21_04610 [Flavobacteriales bacterium]|jgi:hypothetical protein|tara:strand:+ start:871 stop:1398 length:528 start_codon:yes stop_codon:yes gene_type:complete
MKNFNYLLLALLLVFSSRLFAGNELGFPNKKPLVSIFKSGPYLGLQRGKYTNLEFGYEFQRKAVKLIKPTIQALNTGFDYNLTENVLGFSIGYWQKRGRLDLTYGANLVYKTDFDQTRIGIAPTLGYRISIAHLQVGANLLTKSDDFKNTNTFFVSLRVVMINNRNFKWRKRKRI